MCVFCIHSCLDDVIMIWLIDLAVCLDNIPNRISTLWKNNTDSGVYDWFHGLRLSRRGIGERKITRATLLKISCVLSKSVCAFGTCNWVWDWCDGWKAFKKKRVNVSFQPFIHVFLCLSWRKTHWLRNFAYLCKMPHDTNAAPEDFTSCRTKYTSDCRRCLCVVKDQRLTGFLHCLF